MNLLRLSGGPLLCGDAILGLFDLDSATEAPTSRRFLRFREAEGTLTATDGGLPKSFVLTAKENAEESSSAVYFTHTTTASLVKLLD